MTPEERSLLERTLKMTEENNELLRSIRRTSRISFYVRMGYWVVILLISFGAYYFIQPYFSTLLNVYGGGSTDANSVQNAADSLKDLFK